MATGTQTQPHGKLLDYEQFIDHQLQRTRQRIKYTDISTACLTLLVGFLAVLFLEVVFDHIFGMPFWLRWTILVTGLLAACAYTASASSSRWSSGSIRSMRPRPSSCPSRP